MEITTPELDLKARTLRAQAMRRLYRQGGQYLASMPERIRENGKRRKQTLFELRNYFRLLKRNIGAIHFDSVKQHHDDELYSDYALQPMDNGITRTSSLYYVVTKDAQNGSINVFWSRAQKYLLSEKDDKGVRRFTHPDGDEENQFRYHLPTLPANATNQDIRDAIREHHKAFRAFSWQRMRLHTADHTKVMGVIRPPKKPVNDNGYESAEVLTFANLDFSLSVHEYPEDKWRLKMHAPVKKRSPEPSMVDSYGLHTAKEYLNEFFTNARTVMEFDNRAEALAYQWLMANHRTQRTWRGQNPNPVSEAVFNNTTTQIYNFTVKEIDDKENVEESEFDTGVTLITVAILSARLLFSVSTGKLIIGAVVSGFGMRKGLEAYKRAKVWFKWHKPWSKGITEVDPVNGPYRENSKINYNRALNAKPNPAVIPRLEVLDGNSKFPEGTGKDITHDDIPPLSHREKYWKEKWISAFDAKAFGGITSGIDRQTSTDFSFNGLIRLSHRCPKTREIITYAKYVEALDVNDKISIPSEIKKLLKDGNIIRISQQENRKSFTKAIVTKEELLEEITPRLFIKNAVLTDEDHERAHAHVSWLFNHQAKKQEKVIAEDKLTEEEAQSDDIIAVDHEWPKKDAKTEKMRKFFGEDWEEMRPSDEKVEDLIAFFKGAVFPTMTPYIEQAVNSRWELAKARAETMKMAA